MFNSSLIALLSSWLITCAFTNSEIVCSKNEVAWKDAISNCLNIGKPMSFHGVTGLHIEYINLRPDVTVWTSDFIYSNQYHGGCLCSFRDYTKGIFVASSEELFSYCSDFKYIFCLNKTNNVMEVLNNTWDYASKCRSFPLINQLSILKPGYYWKTNTSECGTDGLAMSLTENLWQTKAVLCGSYSKGAGRHFRKCNTHHRLVCVSSGTGLRLDLFDGSCFIANPTKTTKMTTLVSMSNQSQRTKPSENVLHTKQSNRPTTDNVTPSGGYTTKFSETSTRRTQSTSETQILNGTLGYARGSSHEHGDPDTGTDAGTIAGIVVGVIFALVGGGVLFIVIRKRYRCLFDKNTTSISKPKTNNDSSKLSKARALFTNLAYDTWDDNQKQNQTKQSKPKHTQVPKNGTSSTNQLRTGKDKELPSWGNTTCSKQSSPIYVNDLNEAQTAASSYSFAEEIESNSEENGMSLDEYDTTISPAKGVYKTENLYNKIEPENESSDVYDSTLRQGQSFETDDVYNKLTCKTNYGKFGTTSSDNEDYDSVGNTLKKQNIQQCTDNVYN